MQAELRVDRFKKRIGAWATVENLPFSPLSTPTHGAIWFPVVDLESKIIRSDICCTNHVEGICAIYIDGKAFDFDSSVDSLRETFDRYFRFRFLRPRAIKLVPPNDEVEEILALCVHPRIASSGDYVLVGRCGGVLDIVQVASIKKSERIAKVFGDALGVSVDSLCPPTDYRKEQYRQSIARLKAPMEGPINFSAKYPKTPSIESKSVVGRSDWKIASLSSVGSKHGHTHVEFEIRNDGDKAIRLLQKPWAYVRV